jgi:hypothetical protein
MGKGSIFAGPEASARGWIGGKEAGNGAKYMIFLD